MNTKIYIRDDALELHAWYKAGLYAVSVALDNLQYVRRDLEKTAICYSEDSVMRIVAEQQLDIIDKRIAYLEAMLPGEVYEICSR